MKFIKISDQKRKKTNNISPNNTKIKLVIAEYLATEVSITR